MSWEDKDDQWTPLIEAVHPINTEDFETEIEARKMISNRHSKGSLVALTIWLLTRAKKAEKELQELKGKT